MAHSESDGLAGLANAVASASDAPAAAEAPMMRASSSTSLAKLDVGGATYSMTSQPQWLRATEEERRAVVGAFATNRSVSSVVMANAAVSDAVAVLWARVLQVAALREPEEPRGASVEPV